MHLPVYEYKGYRLEGRVLPYGGTTVVVYETTVNGVVQGGSGPTPTDAMRHLCDQIDAVLHEPCSPSEEKSPS